MKNDTSELNITSLQQYLANYGEFRALKDIATILQNLSQNWDNAGNRNLRFVFSDAATSIADVAYKLETAEQRHAISQNAIQPGQMEQERLHAEFDKLNSYFTNLSIDEVKEFWNSNKKDFLAKIKRFEFLRKLFNKNK